MQHLCDTHATPQTKIYCMQKVSIIAQPKRKNISDTTAVIIIRGFFNRKPVASISTGHKINTSHWDPEKRCLIKSAPNAALINTCIKIKIQDMEAALMKQEICGHTISRQMIYRAVKGLNDSMDFFEFCRNTIKQDYENKGTRSSYLAEITKLQRYMQVVSFTDIDHHFLQGYKNYMKKDLLNIDNTVWKTFKFINTMINKALHTGGIINENPFKHFNRGNYVQQTKQGLSVAYCNAIEKMAAADGCSPVLKMVAYRFLLMAYSGMRFSDAQKFDPGQHVKGNRIIMQYAKCNTHVNNIMHRRLQHIVDNIHMYPLNMTNQKFNQYLKLIALQCNIPFNLSSHVGRHTMGSLLAQMEIPKDQAALIMGHKDQRSTNIYYHQHQGNIDKALEKLNTL